MSPLPPFHSRAKVAAKTLQYFFGAQLFFAVMVVSFTLGGPIAFGVIMALPLLVAWISGKRKSYYFIFYFICMTFVIGQRTLYIGKYTRLVPAEVLLYILALASSLIRPQYPSPGKAIPWTVYSLSLFSTIAIFTAAQHDFYYEQDINFSFSYAHMMWMSIPAFFVCYRLVQRIEHLQTFVTLLSMGCLFLSFLALSEYFHLPYMKLFGGFVAKDIKSMDAIMTGAEGFRRLGGTFWGGPMLAGYLSLSLPLIIALWFNSKTRVQKSLVGMSIILSLLTIYFSGHRGLWVALVFAILAYFFLKGIKGILVIIVLLGISFVVMPEGARVRMETIYGEKRDSSSEEREKLAREAWRLIQEQPIVGNGWGSSGLVHSDLLQLWADAGAGAILSFLILWFGILFRLRKTLKLNKQKIFREYGCGFFASMIGALITLSEQAWFNLPEQYAPFWVLTALAYQYSNIVAIEKKAVFAEVQAIHKNATEGKQHA